VFGFGAADLVLLVIYGVRVGLAWEMVFGALAIVLAFGGGFLLLV
jgi:hypothetical protein